MRSVTLPHKFKIGVGGCPNSCVKPSLNDVGIEGRHHDGRAVCRITVGGTWGKIRRDGTLLPRDFAPEEVGDAVEKILLFYRENGYEKERLGALVDRVGVDALLSAIEGDGLLSRREEILSAPIRPRPAQ
jgi:dissimilatory sulfite reductase (desulfoviridin) alpha/beta subunit